MVKKLYDKKWDKTFKLDLENKKCECGMFEENHYPCIHITAYFHSLCDYHKIMEFVDEGYSRSRVQQTCMILIWISFNVLKEDLLKKY